MKRSTIEKAFAGLVLFLSTGALLPLIFSDQTADRGDVVANPAIQGIWALLYAITVLLLARRWKRSLWLLLRDRLLLALVLLAILSIFWSASPTITLRRTIALAGTTLVGVYLAQRFSLEELLRLLAFALGTAAVLSFAFAVALPELGVMSGNHEGAWRGVYIHKNHLGRYMSLGTLVLYILAERRRGKIGYILGALVCMCMLLLSTSRSALLVLIGGIVSIIYLRGFRSDIRVLVPYVIIGLIIGGGIAAWVAHDYAALLTALGRDPTLTGRTVLWSLVVEAIGRRPWLGYGYDAFWTGWGGESEWIWEVIRWPAPHAHNGYLDLCLNFGIVGATLYLLSYGRNGVTAVSRARSTVSRIELWPVLLLLFVGAYSMGESVIMQRNNALWILYVDLTIRLVTRNRNQSGVGRFGAHSNCGDQVGAIATRTQAVGNVD